MGEVRNRVRVGDRRETINRLRRMMLSTTMIMSLWDPRKNEHHHKAMDLPNSSPLDLCKWLLVCQRPCRFGHAGVLHLRTINENHTVSFSQQVWARPHATCIRNSRKTFAVAGGMENRDYMLEPMLKAAVRTLVPSIGFCESLCYGVRPYIEVPLGTAHDSHTSR